ncbi:hypothetical protein [Amphibacillus sediminis]|nr:hypothetical protein [Amphibacillus sediminis]
MRKGLIILFLLLVITFGLIGILQSDDHHDIKIQTETTSIHQ